MKLQKISNRKVGDVEYSKFVIVLPKEPIKELDWSKGEELEFNVCDNKLVIKSQKHV